MGQQFRQFVQAGEGQFEFVVHGALAQGQALVRLSQQVVQGVGRPHVGVPVRRVEHGRQQHRQHGQQQADGRAFRVVAEQRERG